MYSLWSPEATLIVPDFTTSVYGSSCNYLFLASFFIILNKEREYDRKRDNCMSCRVHRTSESGTTGIMLAVVIFYFLCTINFKNLYSSLNQFDSIREHLHP